MTYEYKHLGTPDVSALKALLKLFAEVFEEPHTYQGAVPSDTYLEQFLRDDRHIVMVAVAEDGAVIGGLVAYELIKFEQERSEIFVYDLAVAEAHRRRGVATRFFDDLERIAGERGAYEIFVQADKGDEGAIAFYRSLNTNELAAHHFEINV